MRKTQDVSTKSGRTQVRAARAVGYVRVSRVGGRGGDSFISPELQREKIAEEITRGELELVELLEDFDESGGKFERPGFQRALELVEAGEASVIVVARLSRFARSVLDTHRALERIEAAGGRLIAGDVPVDTSTPIGRMMRGLLALLAEFELDLAKEQWGAAKSSAIAKGVAIMPKVPFGYRRGADRRFELEPDEAAVVEELFRMRAAGASWSELAGRLEAFTRRPAFKESVSYMIANRVYRGEVRYGRGAEPLVNLEAHPAIVDEELFAAAQAPSEAYRASRPRYDRGVKSLLAGLARCGTCGGPMNKTTAGKTGRGVAFYRCQRPGCEGRARIVCDKLDAYVEDAVMRWAGELADEQVEAVVDARDPRRRPELEEELRLAELALDVYVTDPDNFGLEPATFKLGVRARTDHVDRIRQELELLEDVDELVAIRASLRQAWPLLDTTERRRLLDSVVDRVTVAKARGRGRGAEPLEERVRIVLRDGRVIA